MRRIAQTPVGADNTGKSIEQVFLKENTLNAIVAILDTVNTLIMIVDRQGKIVHFNRVCEQVSQYCASEVEGKYLWDFLLPPEQVHLIKSLFEQQQPGMPPNCYESYWVRKNGTRYLSGWSNTAIVDEQGAVEYIVATGIDITVLKETKTALQVCSNNYQAIFHNATDAIFIQNLSTLEFLDVNQTACEMFGYTRTEMLRLSIDDISLGEPPYARTDIMQWVQKAVKTGIPQTFEWLSKHKNCQLFWTEANLKTAVIGEGDCLLVIKRDISKRKQIEEALRQSEAQFRQQAEQVQRALEELKQAQFQLIQNEKMLSLGQLVAGVAHEVNNPLSFIHCNLNLASKYIKELFGLLKLYQQDLPNPTPAIQSEIEAIELDFLLEDFPQLLASMKRGTERIIEIVTSLQNFSRLYKIDKKPTDIHQGLDNTLLLLQHRLIPKAGDWAIQVKREYGNLPLVECCACSLNQVFMNILNNAIDAIASRLFANAKPTVANANDALKGLGASGTTTDTPLIWIGTEVLDHQQVQIRIADNGSGICDSVKQRLFDPFFTTKPVGQGTGLGLSISYQIVVEQHGGQLQCNSVLGQGAEFLILIPIKGYKTKLSISI